MVRYRDADPAPIIMLDAHIVKMQAGQVWWSWRGHTYGPTPVGMDPVSVTVTHQGSTGHSHQGAVTRDYAGLRCKVITSRANLADGVVIPFRHR